MSFHHTSSDSLHSPELSPSSLATPATSPHPSLERRGIRDPFLPLPKGEKEGVASISPTLSSVESLRSSLPESYQSLFDMLRKEVRDFCDCHSIPTSSLHNNEALRGATKHLSLSDLKHLSLVLARLEYLVTHKEPMPEKRTSLTQEQAREIMGENFLGIHEVEEHFGELSDEQQEILSIIPFSRETLEACKETHILVADIGSSFLDIRNIKIPENKKLFFKQALYDKQEFAKHTEGASWRLIRKTSVEDSFDKTWDEQQSLINQETDEIPSIRQVVYMMILRCLATGEHLFETCYVRTCDVGPNSYQLSVGYFDKDGLHVSDWVDGLRGNDIGVSSSRRFDF